MLLTRVALTTPAAPPIVLASRSYPAVVVIAADGTITITATAPQK